MSTIFQSQNGSLTFICLVEALTGNIIMRKGNYERWQSQYQ